MGLLALFLLIILPIIEIYLFIEIGGALGAGWTILLIFLTAAIGVSAMRQQGLAVLQEAQSAQAAGRPPLAAAAHGLLILLGGGLLLLPGFLTDAIGFLCLFRPIRLFLISVQIRPTRQPIKQPPIKQLRAITALIITTRAISQMPSRVNSFSAFLERKRVYGRRS